MKNKIAFSLIELLISLIIISIITLALAPIMTRKFAKNNLTVKIADSRHGLMIYTNPGTYSFDVPEAVDKIYFSGAAGGGGGAGAVKAVKNIKAVTNSTWIVPNGVNKVTFTITGSGGGGGGGYASYNPQACVSGYNVLPSMADDGKDICAGSPRVTSGYIKYHDNYSVQSIDALSCWRGAQMVCSYTAASIICRDEVGAIGKNARLLKKSELSRILKASNYPASAGYLGFNYLNMCAQGGGVLPSCSSSSACKSPNTIECDPYQIFYQLGEDRSFDFNAIFFLSNGVFGVDRDLIQYYYLHSDTTTGQVRCVYIKSDWLQYSGSGGYSGAQLTQTISVLPNEKLTFIIGSSGSGGMAGRAGSQGGITKVIHTKLNGSTVTYEVKGGLGGAAAALNANGNNTAASTPVGTCLINGVNTNCSKQSNAGANGVNTTGGSGAVTYQSTLNPALGGDLDLNRGFGVGVGQNASEYGFGGGGGTCARGVRNPNYCQKGGNGQKGKVDISYELILPGGGGGAGAAIGMNANGINQEIEYSVAPSTRIVFTIGKGGSGGAASQAGAAGAKTTIMEDEIIFNAGSGGSIGNATTLLAGKGGSGGELKIKNSIKSKVNILNVPSASLSNAGKGLNGLDAQLKDASGKYINYGLDGGIGGSTFLGYFGGCGGGIITDIDSSRGCQTSARNDGIEAKIHNSVKNQFGGAGGGGGGATATNSTPGSGADGADGYLRIRWGD